jgi:hypothetical protein
MIVSFVDPRRGKDLVMAVLCRFVGHHRSRRFASFNVADDRWESICTRCKTRVIRSHGGKWHKATNLEYLHSAMLSKPPNWENPGWTVSPYSSAGSGGPLRAFEDELCQTGHE